MRRQSLILFGFVLLAVPMFTLGQTVMPVKFARGDTSTVATGSLNSYQSKPVVFKISVKEGQTMRIDQVKSNKSRHYVTFSITNPAGDDVTDLDASCNNTKTIENTAGGDYHIQVSECKKADPWRGIFKVRFTVK